MNKRPGVFTGLILVLAAIAVYWPLQNDDFINFDDDIYVYENRYVKRGLTGEGVAWAFRFSNKEGLYWHPLTWLSHSLDCEIFGLKPGKHHLTNLIFHVASSLLLFMALKRITGAPGRSAFVAALFALHPMNVESVAWVAQRKNVLSTFFWILTLLNYACYAKTPRLPRYLSTLFVFALGLLAKPMLVTLPCVLLLLDYWPLERMTRFRVNGGKDVGRPISMDLRSPVFSLILEKVPFFLLSFLSIYLSTRSLQHQGVMTPLDPAPLSLRIANAIVSYVNYIGKMIWPQDLAILYPFPDSMIPTWKIAVCGLILAVVSALVVRTAKRFPFLFTGWWWYMGTLVPVIGLVQTGFWPAFADRWAYIPLIGLFIMIAWGVPEFLARWRPGKTWLASAAIVVLAVLMLLTRKQTAYWKDSITLWQHTLEVTQNNYLPHNNLGNALAKQGRIDEAVAHYFESLKIRPGYEKAHNNLGIALKKKGRIDEAITHYSEALRIRPDYSEAHNNLGTALADKGRINEAIAHYTAALRIKAGFAEAHNNLGNALAKQGNMEEAITHYSESLKINPDYAEAHNNLGNALARQGRMEEAIAHYSEALRIRPDFAQIHTNLGNALAQQGRTGEAITHYSEALRADPDNPKAHYNLGITLATQGRMEEAMTHYSEALRIKPDFVEAHINLGSALYGKGDIGGAMDHYRAALRIRPDHSIAKKNLDELLK